MREGILCLFDDSGESAVLHHLNLDGAVLCHLLLYLVVVHCLHVGVDTILVACELVLFVAQDVELNVEFKLILLAVADSTDEPFFAFALSNDYIFNVSSK